MLVHGLYFNGWSASSAVFVFKLLERIEISVKN